jgi:hypothetical protein
MIERKIQNAPAGQGTVRMLTREEWEEIREVRPRTPFESKLARPNAQIRTEEPLRLVRHLLLVNLLTLFCNISVHKLFFFIVWLLNSRLYCLVIVYILSFKYVMGHIKSLNFLVFI